MNQGKSLGDLSQNHLFPFLHYEDVCVSCSTRCGWDVLPKLLVLSLVLSVVLFIRKHVLVAVQSSFFRPGNELGENRAELLTLPVPGRHLCTYISLCWISGQKDFILLFSPSPQSHPLPLGSGATGSTFSVQLCWKKLVIAVEKRWQMVTFPHRRCFSYSRWQSFACKRLMVISVCTPFGVALSSALPGGADSITSKREDLLLTQPWVLPLCFSALPAVANDKDQHSHHELSNQ